MISITSVKELGDSFVHGRSFQFALAKIGEAVRSFNLPDAKLSDDQRGAYRLMGEACGYTVSDGPGFLRFERRVVLHDEPSGRVLISPSDHENIVFVDLDFVETARIAASERDLDKAKLKAGLEHCRGVLAEMQKEARAAFGEEAAERYDPHLKYADECLEGCQNG